MQPGTDDRRQYSPAETGDLLEHSAEGGWIPLPDHPRDRRHAAT